MFLCVRVLLVCALLHETFPMKFFPSIFCWNSWCQGVKCVRVCECVSLSIVQKYSVSFFENNPGMSLQHEIECTVNLNLIKPPLGSNLAFVYWIVTFEAWFLTELVFLVQFGSRRVCVGLVCIENLNSPPLFPADLLKEHNLPLNCGDSV